MNSWLWSDKIDFKISGYNNKLERQDFGLDSYAVIFVCDLCNILTFIKGQNSGTVKYVDL